MVHRCPETVLGASQSRLCFIPRVTYRRIYSKHFLSEHGRQLHGRIPAPPRSSGPVWSEFCSEKPNQGGISHTAQGDLFICFSPLLFQINIPGRKSRCIYLADFFCSVRGLNDIIFSGRELKVGLNPSASIFCFGYWSDGISLSSPPPPMTDLLLSCTTCENACTPAGVYACVCACLCMGVSARARVCMCVCTRMGVRGCARMCACRCRWVCMRVFVQEASRRGWRMVVPWLRVHRAQGATECLIHAAGQRWLQQKRCWMHQKQHWVQQGWQ